MQKQINFDDVVKENIKKHNWNWSRNPDHSYRILIIRGSGSRKKSLFNLINYQADVDKIYLYAKDPFEAKYQLLINKRESTDLKYFNNSKAWKYLNDMDDIYKNIEAYNPNKKRKIVIVLMIWLLIWLVTNP